MKTYRVTFHTYFEAENEDEAIHAEEILLDATIFGGYDGYDECEVEEVNEEW